MRLRAAAIIALLLAAPVGADTLPFVENDYARALKQARAKKLPIFVEAWAPW